MELPQQEAVKLPLALRLLVLQQRPVLARPPAHPEGTEASGQEGTLTTTGGGGGRTPSSTVLEVTGSHVTKVFLRKNTPKNTCERV